MRPRFLGLILFTVLLPTLIPSSFGQTQTGQFVGKFADQFGASQYTILYSFPQNDSIGTNFPVQLILLVNQLTGQRTFVYGYAYVVNLYCANGAVLVAKYSYVGPKYFYAGAHTNPINVTFPINATALQLSPGQKTIGSLEVTVDISVYYGPPVGAQYPDVFREAIGNATFSYPASSANSVSVSSSGGLTVSSTVSSSPPGQPMPYWEIIAAVVVVAGVGVAGAILRGRLKGGKATH